MGFYILSQYQDDYEREISILMEKNTRSEAEYYLKSGTVIYDSVEDYVQTEESDYPDSLKEMMETAGCESPQDYVDFLKNNNGFPGYDLSIVSHNDHDYLVRYFH